MSTWFALFLEKSSTSLNVEVEVERDMGKSMTPNRSHEKPSTFEVEILDKSLEKLSTFDKETKKSLTSSRGDNSKKESRKIKKDEKKSTPSFEHKWKKLA